MTSSPVQSPLFARSSPLMAALALSTLLLAGGTAMAGDWELQPSIEEDMSIESNPLLLNNNNNKNLYGSVTTPKISITDATPTTLFSGQFSAVQNIFNESGFDSTDAHAAISLDKKMQQWEAGFTEQTDYDTTRTSELTTLNTNTDGSVRHIGNTISPVISYSPTTEDKISLAGSATESTYDSDIYTNYHIFTVTPSYQYNFTQKDTGIFSVQAQRYETEGTPASKIDSIAPSLGWTSLLTPALTFKTTAGIEDYRPESPQIQDPSWTWKFIYSADLIYKGIQDSLDLGANRGLQPYPNGTEFFLNTISLTEAHTFNTLFSGNIGASYQFADNSGEAATNLKELTSANAGIAYHATDKFDVTASYQFREQTLTNVSGDAKDNLFLVGLVYRPKLDGVKW